MITDRKIVMTAFYQKLEAAIPELQARRRVVVGEFSQDLWIMPSFRPDVGICAALKSWAVGTMNFDATDTTSLIMSLKQDFLDAGLDHIFPFETDEVGSSAFSKYSRDSNEMKLWHNEKRLAWIRERAAS